MEDDDYSFTFEGKPLAPHRSVRCFLPSQARKGFERRLARAWDDSTTPVALIWNAGWALTARHFALNPRVEHHDVLWSYPELERDLIPERYLPWHFCSWDRTVPS